MNALLWIFQFTFGCRHRHLSRVFTIKHRTYRVCFDCGSVEKKLNEASNKLGDVRKRSRVLTKRLRDVQEQPQNGSEKILQLDSYELSAQADEEGGSNGSAAVESDSV